MKPREPAPSVDIVDVARAIGVPGEHVREVDPLDLKAVSQAIDDGVAAEGPFVIVTRRPCVLIPEIAKESADRYCVIDPEKCVGCRMCMKIACPAIAFRDGKAGVFDRISRR